MALATFVTTNAKTFQDRKGAEFSEQLYFDILSFTPINSETWEAKVRSYRLQGTNEVELIRARKTGSRTQVENVEGQLQDPPAGNNRTGEHIDFVQKVGARLIAFFQLHGVTNHQDLELI